MLLKDVIDKITREIHTDISYSRKLGIAYGEETITDILLLNLAKINSYNLRILQTSKMDESKYGTDWEWFIGSQNYGWTRIAIQAKKSQATKRGNYTGLAHMVGKKPNLKKQIDVFTNYVTGNKNIVPLYCFYNNHRSANPYDHWNCNKNYDSELLGWTITPLKNIKKALRTYGGRNFDFIHKLRETIPMKCLFDCPIILRRLKSKKNTRLELFGTQIEKIQKLPEGWIDKRDIIITDNYPDELYDRNLDLYPKRIGIITLE